MRFFKYFKTYKLLRILITTFTLIILFLISSLSLAYAYTLLDYKWRTHQTGLDYDHLSSGWKSVVYNSRTAWNNAGADMEIYYSSISQNDIAVRYYDTNWTGLTKYWGYWAGRWYFSEVDVYLNTKYVDPTYGSLLPARDRVDGQSTGTHELGHLVGLDHSGYGTTMYAYSESGTIWKRSLHSDDIAGVKAIYGLK